MGHAAVGQGGRLVVAPQEPGIAASPAVGWPAPSVTEGREPQISPLPRFGPNEQRVGWRSS
jgi:hypothetical protein